MKRMIIMALLLTVAAAAVLYLCLGSGNMRAQTMTGGASLVYSRQNDHEMKHNRQTEFPPFFGETDYTLRGINDTEIRRKEVSAFPGEEYLGRSIIRECICISSIAK